MLRPFNESKKKWPNGKKILIGLTLLVVVIAVIGFYLYYNSSLLFNPPEVKVIEGTYTLNDVIAVSNNVVAFAGANLSNNISEGIAGEYFLQNSSYLFFNLGEYLQDGTIYSIAYNGSSFLLAGAQSIKENNVTVLQPEVVLYTNGKAINISKLIPDTYTPGQAYAASWTGSYWLVGGSSLVIEGTAQYNVPFLVKILPNLTSIDLTPKLPNYFYSPLSVGSGIYTVSSHNGQFLVGGSHLFNYSVTLFNGSSFQKYPQDPGSILSSVYSPEGWIIGGYNYSSNPNVSLTMLGVVNGSDIDFINLKYSVGIVVAVGYGDDTYVISLRVPAINEGTGTASEEGIILMGKTLTSLSEIYSATNTSINSVTIAGNHLVGVGYTVTNQERHGIILILRMT
ncbi:hypothetical protein [Sulfolobus acidocaldarius]|uniref:Uncharacterized protein n=4 Tax=Sulfolobus acidocaldarius TaxID=2285 RepID=Q4J812_SULAC|nr:hypothetical protein [Sulfolobus acidocaldarius]AAY81067.1 hypothetical protein Saci_1761 [Sulfolobus acidocaldarius DSM 639]AGE71674.1 hypothetical protein SacN8_08570 [Sulfolobus acidocaldarius N8]AGE73947.1 hypothetical protein SacRon12I_08580 [Sulfolobus acidocaldarius Ron12/I]ALU30114.1 hypothetical protein ATY89_09325 [Sulfolobus acidocaldarius]ALU30808.1 hypothetical protein ATZ20_00735 [Sulfolobus acidocaldarius]